ncbi:MAG TPA: hypothetical protein VI757_11160 [Bacteroidia bacterium]|nr:hypothetical protein [Bacteroidia bacterium]
MLYTEFYSALGKLLYAVADVDGTITQKEKKALREIVRNELAPAEKHTDFFGTDAAYYAETEFDFLEEGQADSETAFNSFIDFVEEHHTAFDERMKKVCLHVANELATAYKKKNKKEDILIGKLKQKLGKLFS